MRKIHPRMLLALILLLLVSTQAGLIVNKLDGVSSTNLVYSGMLPVSNSSNDQLFFTYYSAKDAKSQSNLANYPLLVFVGSPGSSAQYYNLAGIGPSLLKPDMTVTSNPNTVTQFANVMFVDLLGNGFSFVANTSTLPTKSQEYGNHLTYAINALISQSSLGKTKSIVIVGQGIFLRSIIGLGDIPSLAGLIHISAWPQLYAVSRFYGVAGIQLKIFANSQRIAIQSTLISCYNNVLAKKYTEAHNCYDSILNFVESKTKNINVFNTHLGSNLTEHLPMIQNYFSQDSTVKLFKAPSSQLFQTQSNWAWSKTYTDFAVNKTANLSAFMKDYLSVKQWYISGDYDYIAYKQSLRFWLENELSFIESAQFRNAKLEDVIVNGKTVGSSKQVKQLKYTELIASGHYAPVDQPDVFSSLLKDWLAGLSEERKNHITKQNLELVQQ